MIYLRLITAWVCVFVAVDMPAFAAAREIRVTLQLPSDSALHQSIALFKTEVEKNSQGSLEVKIFASAELYKAEEVREAVGSGAIEMGAVLLGEYVEIIPATDIFALPFMFPSLALLRAGTAPGSAIRAPIDQAILSEANAHVLWWFSSGASVVLSKGEPVLTPSAIAGKKVRVSSSSLAEMVKLCGGEPLETGGSEQYGFYKSGAVDVGLTSQSVIAARKLWEVMDTLTITNHTQSEFVIVMHDKVWASLSPDEQQIIGNAARHTEQISRDMAEQVAREGPMIAQQHGMKIFETTQEHAGAWKNCATPMLSGYLNRSGELGRQVMDGYRKAVIEAYRPRR
jgi:C4-dicarboxylate-binding protein DctP